MLQTTLFSLSTNDPNCPNNPTNPLEKTKKIVVMVYAVQKLYWMKMVLAAGRRLCLGEGDAGWRLCCTTVVLAEGDAVRRSGRRNAVQMKVTLDGDYFTLPWCTEKVLLGDTVVNHVNSIQKNAIEKKQRLSTMSTTQGVIMFLRARSVKYGVTLCCRYRTMLLSEGN